MSGAASGEVAASWPPDPSARPPAEAPPVKAPPQVAYGTWLRTERLRTGLTMAELAARCHTSKAWVSRIEAGKGVPVRSLALAFAEACGVDPFASLASLEKASEKRNKGRTHLIQNKEDIRAAGRARRLQILRALVEWQLTKGMRINAPTVGRAAGVTSGTATSHLRQLIAEGLVEDFQDPHGGAYHPMTLYQVTLEGIDRAMVDGWKPPLHLIDPVIAHLARMARDEAAAVAAREHAVRGDLP